MRDLSPKTHELDATSGGFSRSITGKSLIGSRAASQKFVMWTSWASGSSCDHCKDAVL
jgi:hypothetical protein